jgi:hypothetical protein
MCKEATAKSVIVALPAWTYVYGKQCTGSHHNGGFKDFMQWTTRQEFNIDASRQIPFS